MPLFFENYFSKIREFCKKNCEEILLNSLKNDDAIANFIFAFSNYVIELSN